MYISALPKKALNHETVQTPVSGHPLEQKTCPHIREVSTSGRLKMYGFYAAGIMT